MSARPNQPDWSASSDRWLTLDEAAARLALSPNEVAALCREGRLNSLRQHSVTWVLEADVDLEHLAQRHRASEPAQSKIQNPQSKIEAVWITTEQAASLLGITPAGVNALPRRGKL